MSQIDNMEIWFIQLENWFKVLQQVYTIVRDPHCTNRYQAIVDTIIHNFADSEQQRIRKLYSKFSSKIENHHISSTPRSGDVQDE